MKPPTSTGPDSASGIASITGWSPQRVNRLGKTEVKNFTVFFENDRVTRWEGDYFAEQDEELARRVAVVDWDVHHGNGTEAIFYEDPEVLTISLHQEACFPLDKGASTDRGAGKGLGGTIALAYAREGARLSRRR